MSFVFFWQVLGAAYPWVARRLLTQPSPELRVTLNQLLYKDNKFQFERLEQLLQQAVRSMPGSSRSVTLSRAARARSAQMLQPAGPSPSLTSTGQTSMTDAGSPLMLLLSEDGRYVRGLLEDELAKGLDAAWRLATDNALQQVTSTLSAVAAALPLLPMPGFGSSRENLNNSASVVQVSITGCSNGRMCSLASP